MRNLIYLSPKLNKPIGGIKVIHKHSELINRMGFKSQIYYIYGACQEVNWFEHAADIKNDSYFSSNNDFVIIPESQIFNTWEKFYTAGVPYAIFVQNGYLITKNIDLNKMRDCYEKAHLIIVISSDSARCIFSIFPEFASKVIRVIYSVETSLFRPLIKEKLITYMPRKMASHSELLVSLLRGKIPKDWRIEPIDNMSESGVAEILSRSSVFLAFSDFEGLPIPPVEAALSGNFVIGYTGQGGSEYWHEPVFKRIEMGDIISFLEETLSRIDRIEKFGSTLNSEIMSDLVDIFSPAHEEKKILELINMVKKCCPSN